MMPSSDYRTAPLATTTLPPGIAYIIGNEAAERFSYYGMRAILIVFMTQYLLSADGVSAPMPEDEAKGWFHLFVMAFFMLSISLGNLFTSAVNFLIRNDDGSSKLAGADYFLFFTGLMLVTAIIFSIVARFYNGQRHLHQEQPG